MCGIAGIFSDKKLETRDFNCLYSMLKKIIHRGPDAEGIYEDKNVLLGMRRLSIIDISSSGNQPFYNEDSSIIVIGNGEIYNYIELKKELKEKGHIFYSNSDIEVIAHLYEEYELDMFEKINGMFSIAIWDKKNDKLILSRDRVGEKPLFYRKSKNKIYFASEIKCLINADDYVKNVNSEAIGFILTYNYIPNNLTIFKDIYSLPAGSFMVCQKDNISIRKYWDFKICGEFLNKEEKVICDELYEILYDSVRIRSRSDVNIGAFLSGGVDSSSVVALMKNIVQYPIETFSIGFNNEIYNELPYAKKVAKHLGVNFNYNIVAESDFVNLLPHIVALNDNPHGDVSFLPTFKVAELAHQYVKVVMTGDGSDELFAGYDKYKNYMSKYSTFGISEYLENNAVFTTDLKQKILVDKEKFDADIEEPIKNALSGMNNIDLLSKLLILDQKLLLNGNNLVKPDRMGMGNSIEARMPFLDHRVIEYASKIPSELKIKGNISKYILKRAFEKYLPQDILYTKKRMFTVPIGEWFKHNSESILLKVLKSKTLRERGIFNKDILENMIDLHINGKMNYTRQLRLILILELWFRYYVDGIDQQRLYY